jgi:hypothetical protein
MSEFRNKDMVRSNVLRGVDKMHDFGNLIRKYLKYLVTSAQEIRRT